MALIGQPLIRFPQGSFPARFVRREKRFLVEVETGNRSFWVHCNNSGSMLGLLRRGTELFLSPALRPGRRLQYTLELVRLGDFWVGVNTLTPNRLLHLAWNSALLTETAGYAEYKKEARIGNSRIDASLTGPHGQLWVEAKNVTLVEDDVAYFPDARTIRGQKHLRELIALARKGKRVACFCLVQREDARCFAPADFIDPDFAQLFWEAIEEGLEVWPYLATVSPEGIGLGARLNLSRH